MGFFDKKYCDVCGEKIGLLGNRKLEDGNLCKGCAAKLSPFFSERKNSTVEEIKRQLAYREGNRELLREFRASRSIGVETKVILDENLGWFVVTSESDLLEANPDIMKLEDVLSCNLDIQHSRRELKRKDAEGKQVSFDPPRYEYSYTFYMEIGVQHPYFSQMRFRLNPRDVEIVSEPPRHRALTGAGRFLNGMPDDIHPEYNVEYREYLQMGDEIIAALMPASSNTVSPVSVSPAQKVQTEAFSAVNDGSWTCSACGTVNQGKFCEGCGSKKPEQSMGVQCSGCGWKPEDSSHLPKFCPECGKPF